MINLDGFSSDELRAFVGRPYTSDMERSLQQSAREILANRAVMNISIRWTITHINTRGERVMTFARQSQNCYLTRCEAQIKLDQLLDVDTNGNDIPGVFGEQALGTFQVRPVECYPNTGDPITRWFD